MELKDAITINKSKGKYKKDDALFEWIHKSAYKAKKSTAEFMKDLAREKMESENASKNN